MDKETLSHIADGFDCSVVFSEDIFIYDINGKCIKVCKTIEEAFNFFLNKI